jgi:hypothetical protein
MPTGARRSSSSASPAPTRSPTIRPPPINKLSAAAFDRMFPDEDACRAYLVARRWPDGIRCPHCGNPAVYDLPSRKWHWLCKKCAPDGYRFSHIAGTIFGNTKKPLRDWYRAVHMMLTADRRGMAFGSDRTARSMCNKIRTALMQDIDQLGGIVEVDVTFVGGLAAAVVGE